MFTIKLITVILAFLIFALILELARRGKLTFKYSAGWLLFCVFGAGFAIFDKFLFALADACGFTLMSNFIFFGLFCFFIFLSLMLTVFLCQQNKRNDLMAQKIAQLEDDLKIHNH
ncbi:MAG: DUF2304 domain-containing protein [Candidatus Aceula meridiana]|nr:DUF2304 domain-containing protein [Candidatus Aceula meridiana]